MTGLRVVDAGPVYPTLTSLADPANLRLRDEAPLPAAAMAQLEPAPLVVHRFIHAPDGADEVVDALDEAAVEAAGALEPVDTAARLAAWRTAHQVWPDAAQVAVFDTAFFADLPLAAQTYALPPELAAEHDLYRRGRHGPVHRLAAASVEASRVVSVHLGHESTDAAIRDGRPVEVSAGVTALEGIPGGSTCGDVDPAVLLYLIEPLGLALDEVEQAVAADGGLAGVGRGRATLAALRESGDADAELALAHLVHRVRRYCGSFAAVMDGLDALVFSSGPEFDDAGVREAVAEGLAHLGLGGRVALHSLELTPPLAAATVALRSRS